MTPPTTTPRTSIKKTETLTASVEKASTSLQQLYSILTLVLSRYRVAVVPYDDGASSRAASSRAASEAVSDVDEEEGREKLPPQEPQPPGSMPTSHHDHLVIEKDKTLVNRTMRRLLLWR